MAEIELTLEKQYSYLKALSERMENINSVLPDIAGEGDLNTALEILQAEFARIITHLQRSYVLISGIREAIDLAKSEFEPAGGDFHGTSTPIN